jgi:hypothetical protein
MGLIFCQRQRILFIFMQVGGGFAGFGIFSSPEFTDSRRVSMSRRAMCRMTGVYISMNMPIP